MRLNQQQAFDELWVVSYMKTLFKLSPSTFYYFLSKHSYSFLLPFIHNRTHAALLNTNISWLLPVIFYIKIEHLPHH